MNTLVRSAFTLGLIFALPATGYAVGAEAPNPANRAMHHHKQDFAKATALGAPQGVVVEPSALSRETDGLSRNDEECNMGRIDH